jgi:hypothetical protein
LKTERRLKGLIHYRPRDGLWKGVNMPARGFARVDPFGNLVASQGVVGAKPAVDSRTGRPRATGGAYCFKLEFTPVSVIANSIAHPDDSPFGPIIYTVGPNVSGRFTKDENGREIECPAGFQDAAVVGRVQAGDGLQFGPGGFFVIFD